MVEKTITMSIHEYKMLEIENKAYKERFDELKQEKMVFLTMVTRGMDISQMSGQVVEKDALLKKMQEHLEGAKERMKEREANYERRIERLKEELYQASIKSVATKWWHKLLK